MSDTPSIHGLSVVRAIPEKVLLGILTGRYQVCGGIIRDDKGHIVAHMVNKVDPLGIPEPPSAVSTYQVQRLGKTVAQVKAVTDKVTGAVDQIADKVSHAQSVAGQIGAGMKLGAQAALGQVQMAQMASEQLIAFSKGTMVLSGLPLNVGNADFRFLKRKLEKIDAALQELQKDLKEIKDFLKTQQRAALIDALKILKDISDAPNEETRRHLLAQSRETLGRLHQHYKAEFLEAADEGIISAAEEYFTLTALGHALCMAELDMYPTAARDLEESYGCWLEQCRKVAKEKLLRHDPERFLARRYASVVRTEEILDWMDFAFGEEKGLAWIDEFRAKPSKDSWWSSSLRNTEYLEIDILRRLVSRDRLYQGYCSQYQYFRDCKIRPSVFQQELLSLGNVSEADSTYFLVASI